MLLKVGELAKRSGMTVRMLHHYDAIGLLVPSARSDAGYRLYNVDDIGRLHAIQALRQIGLSLNDVGKLLQGGKEPLPLIIERQIAALKRQIEQAGELCQRLGLLQASLSNGNAPDMAEWLRMLTSMSTYGKYFTASEIKKILENWNLTQAKFVPVISAIRQAMQNKVPPESLEIQPLTRRWMDLNALWMQGDFDLMQRWRQMYLQEPAARGKNGVDLEFISYIGKAVEIRVAALLKFFNEDDLKKLDPEVEGDWLLLAEEIRALVKAKARLTGKKAREAVRKRNALVDRTVRHDPILREKFLHAFGTDPVLRAGSVVEPELQAFIRAAWLEQSKKS